MSKFKLITKNGYDAFEVQSALQKSVRRGMVKESIYWAFELLPGENHKGFETWLWKRLSVIILEDCDWDDAIPKINALREMYFFVKKSGSESSEGLLMVAKAVEILCHAWKGRDTTFRCLLNDTMPKLEIPDWAINDPHTYRGKMVRKKENRKWSDWVKEQQKCLEPTSRPKELYHEMVEKIDEIMEKRKQKPTEEKESDGGLFAE